MEERALETIRLLPRKDLEAFAVRAVVHLRESQCEIESEKALSTLLTGFLLGALVASAAFMIGASLG